MSEHEQPTRSDERRGSGQQTSGPPEQQFQRVDRRYDISDLRSWLVLVVMVALYVAFALTMFLLEPGIR